jgi:hypothetical protein
VRKDIIHEFDDRPTMLNKDWPITTIDAFFTTKTDLVDKSITGFKIIKTNDIGVGTYEATHGKLIGDKTTVKENGISDPDHVNIRYQLSSSGIVYALIISYHD